MTSTAPAKEPAWHESLPKPKNTNPDGFTREEVLKKLTTPSSPKDFILVDLRRTDYTGGTIHGSINLPAQSLYYTIPSLYSLFSAAGIKTVIWYCGSSRGRGTRAAGWFDDYIKDQKNLEMKSVVLEGGIAGWVKAGEEYTKFVDEYQEDAWK